MVVASGSAHGLWVDKPMALAEGLSCMLGVQILTGIMHRPFPGPGCTVETVHGLESDILFWILLSSYHVCDLGQLTSLLAVSQCFQIQNR